MVPSKPRLISIIDFPISFPQCPPMNQATLLRESRSKHTLQNSEAAAKQLRAFKAVLPITKKNSEFLETTQKRQVYPSPSRRTN
jgi:hypothetical protein